MNLDRLADVDPDSIVEGLDDSLRRMPTYRDLYLRWERLNWAVSDLDFRADKDDWRALPDGHKERLLWTLGAFFVAEQRVSATITPYVQAARTAEQKVFLATQCVDEARHEVFFDRWFQEVVASGGSDVSTRLASSRKWLGPGFSPLFDDYLAGVSEALLADPQDPALFAKAIAVYHIVVEGVLALTGQKFILGWARDNRILRGFRAGFTAVARDESRHVAFGVRVLRDMSRADPKLIGPIQEGIAESLPLATWLYQPPGGDVTYTSALGYSLSDLFGFASMQLARKMRALNVPLPEVDVFVPPIAAPWPPKGGGVVARDARQKISSAALRVLGRVAPTFSPGLAIMLLHFGFAPQAARGVKVKYRFELSGPGGGVFDVVIEDGECRILVGASPGRCDVTYFMAAQTWLAMTQGLVTGDEALLLGRLRMKGDPELARRFGEFFAPQGEPAVSATASERPPAA